MTESATFCPKRWRKLAGMALILCACSSSTEPCLPENLSNEWEYFLGRDNAEAFRDAWIDYQESQGWECNVGPELRNAFGQAIGTTATCTRCAP